jgi:hypothetical protein
VRPLSAVSETNDASPALARPHDTARPRTTARGFRVTDVERLRKGTQPCHGEVFDGSQLTYSIMSSPKLSHPTLGIRITGDGATGLVFAARAGPTVVTAGTVGAGTALRAPRDRHLTSS